MNSDSSSAAHHHYSSHRQKNLTPALSTLLSSTTIPCSRVKRRTKPFPKSSDSLAFFKATKPQQPAPETLSFSKQAVSAPLKPKHSRIRSRLGHRDPATIPSSNLNLSSQSPTQESNDDSNPQIKSPEQRDGSEDDEVLEQEPLSIGFTVSTPLWQLNEAEDLDDDLYSTSSSFSSVASSLSSSESTSLLSTSYSTSTYPTRTVQKRKSHSVIASGNRVISRDLDCCLVDAETHPLADDSEEEEEVEPNPKSQRLFSFMTQFTASIKAFTSVASSFSTSHQSLLSASDVFPFSPRSTDEPIPLYTARSSTSLMVPAKKIKSRRQSLGKPTDKQRVTSVSTSTLVPQHPVVKPRAVALETYSVEEFALPPPSRHRDIRENPDFLRIYALETLMRKTGKLSDQFSSGKAQLALMPRSDEVPGSSNGNRFPKYQRPAVEVECTFGGKVRMVPARWVGISAKDL